MDPDPEQRHFIQAIKQHGGRAGGYAGTGKTECIAQAWRELAAEGRPPIIAAPTNKACDVLRQKLPTRAEVRTLHSLALEWVADEPVLGDGGEPVLDKQGEAVRQPQFRPRKAPIYEHVILDEASMIGRQLLGSVEHLLTSYALVGDPFQLAPVGDGQLFTEESCAVVLKRVYRANGPVLKYATQLREGGALLRPPAGIPVLDTLDGSHVDQLRRDDGMAIAHANKDVNGLNQGIRQALRGRDDWRPILGDKVVSRYPDQRRGVYNALTGRVLKASEKGDVVDLVVDWRDVGPVKHRAPGRWFREPKPQTVNGPCIQYAYTMTAHLAQGSEWPYVFIVIREGGLEYVQKTLDPKFCPRRWMYTAATRAREELSLVII